jgi:hypothetical protein
MDIRRMLLGASHPVYHGLMLGIALVVLFIVLRIWVIVAAIAQRFGV